MPGSPPLSEVQRCLPPRGKGLASRWSVPYRLPAPTAIPR